MDCTHYVRLLHNAIHRQGVSECRYLVGVCLLTSTADGSMYQYAAVMGLNKELRLKGNEFSNAATWFFIAFLIAEVPNGMLRRPVEY